MAKLNLLTSGIRAKFTNPVIGTVKTQTVEPDRGFSECCYINYAFGDSTSTDQEKNDIYGGHIFKREDPADTVSFFLEKNGIDLAFTSSFGTLYDFGDIPNQSELTGLKVEWEKVLAVEGEGNYRLRADLNFSSGTSTIYSNTFILRQFSWSLAHNTVRFDAVHNSCFTRLGLDLSGTNWVDQVRVRGIFGYKQREVEQFTHVDGLLDSNHTEIKNVERFTFKSLAIPECISEQLCDRVFLAKSLKVNDYNKNNSKYDYLDFPIVIDKANETKYFERSRKMKHEYIFKYKRNDNEALSC